MRDELGCSPLAHMGEINHTPDSNKVFEDAYIERRGHLPFPPTSPSPVFCTSKADLEKIAGDLSGASHTALDIDRKGDALAPWRGDIRLLTLRRDGGAVWILDLRAIGYELGPLAKVLESTNVIAHNAKFDLLWLRAKCGLRISNVCCTLTAARLLSAGTQPGNGLDQCLRRYLGIPPGTAFGRSDWGAMLLIPDQLDYAARDVAHLHDLLARLEGEIASAGLADVWELERALLPCVVGMEAAGIRVDCEKLDNIAAEARASAASARDELRHALGKPSINPNSPPQLLEALRDAGLVLDSTAEEALKAADDGRLVPLVLAYRKASKRAEQAEKLVGHVQADGRIHARFEPTGTATGRFSSKGPNLQNIGRGELREAFTAPPGFRLIVADYSQVELRAAAAIAGEARMIDAYRAGEDLHSGTAAAVLGIGLQDVGKAQRQLAKAVNFGLLYGQSATGLVRYAASSYGVTLARDEAKQIHGAFFRTYPRLRQWHALCHRKAEEGVTEVRTRLGRRRLIPKAASDWDQFTALVNTPVQGACADGMKRAIALLAGRLPDGARMLSTVHDEVIVEVREADAGAVRDLVTGTMVEAMSAIFPEVPIEVEAEICNDWGGK